jgi:hypothetical protein
MLSSLVMNRLFDDREPPMPLEGLLISAASPEQLRLWVQSGRVSLRGVAARLVEEGAADLVSYDGACQLLSETSLFLEMNRFFLTVRRAAYLLKDALFTLDVGWSEGGLPRYEATLPEGVPDDRYFLPGEAIELLASTVRMRSEIPHADVARVGLVRGVHAMYPGRWMVLLYWDHGGGTIFFDRQDFEAVVVVDEPFSSCSALCLAD